MPAESDSHRWEIRGEQGGHVAQENTRERLSATTQAIAGDVPFLAPLAGTITTVAFAGEYSLYLGCANVHLNHCLH